MSAVMSAAAGILYAGVLGSADPYSGLNFLLPAFAAAFLGATTIQPGRFNPWGAVFAVYFLATGITGLSMLGIPLWVTNVFNGGGADSCRDDLAAHEGPRSLGYWLTASATSPRQQRKRLEARASRTYGAATEDGGGPAHGDLERPLKVCAVTRRRFPVSASPTRQSLQPEACAIASISVWRPISSAQASLALASIV